MIKSELEVLNTLRVAYGELPTTLDRHELGLIAESSRAFGEALVLFGRCERLMRNQEANRAAVGEKLSKADLASAKALNDRGLAALRGAVDQMQAAIKASPFPEKKVPAHVNAALSEFSGDLLPLLASEQIKPSDIVKLEALTAEVVAVAAKGGPNKLLYFVHEKMGALVKLRERADRGAVDNIPIWKIIAIAIFLGLWLVAVIRCLINRRQCSDVTNAALAAGMTIAFLVAWFC